MIQRIFVVLFLLPIRFYRFFISPVIGSHCRFSPSCSAYAQQALEKHGILKGSWLAVRRLSCCHPISFLGGADGYDPVPEQFSWLRSPVCCNKKSRTKKLKRKKQKS